MRDFVEKSIERVCSGPIRRGYDKYRRWKYSRFPTGHIFTIDNDGLVFKLSFLDCQLGNTIIERIEGRREPETVAIQKTLVRNGDRVLELGGCYGYFTTILSNCVGPDGRVISIEGTPNNYKVLQNNIWLNGLQNVEAYNFFITSEAESVGFGSDDKDPYKAILSLKKNAPQKDAEVAVPAIKVSSFLKQINFKPDHIFMDIEGFEVEVLEDLSRSGYLDDFQPNIVFEVHEQFYRGEKDVDYLIHILTDKGYTHRKISGNLLCLPNEH